MNITFYINTVIFPYLFRNKIDTIQSSPENIVPKKYLIKFKGFIIDNNLNIIKYEFNGKKFNLVTKKEDLKKIEL